MGNQQVVCGRFIGEEKPGETRAMRNPNIPEGGDLVKEFRGMSNLKEIFE
jgi:hypothetical protein